MNEKTLEESTKNELIEVILRERGGIMFWFLFIATLGFIAGYMARLI